LPDASFRICLEVAESTDPYPFETSLTGGVLQRQVLEDSIISSGIQHAFQGFAIPIEIEQDSIIVALLQPPFAAPGTFQWMAELGENRTASATIATTQASFMIRCI
jgi:hypothetical protein